MTDKSLPKNERKLKSFGFKTRSEFSLDEVGGLASHMQEKVLLYNILLAVEEILRLQRERSAPDGK